MRVYADFENHFEDLTLEPFVYEYNEEEKIDGHKFVHVRDGIFRAEPTFCVTKEEQKTLRCTYRDVVFFGFYSGGVFEVWFALAEAGCAIGRWFSWYDRTRRVEDLSAWKWWEEDEIDYFNNYNRRPKRELEYIKFDDDDRFCVIDDKVHEIPLPEKKEAFLFRYQKVVREDYQRLRQRHRL